MKTRRKGKVNIANIHSTLHNTILSVTDLKGNIITRSSVGGIGFKKGKRKMPYGAEVLGEKMGFKLKRKGIKELIVKLKGVGRGKLSCVKGLKKQRLKLKGFQEVTPIPHNGCRSRKKRRK